MASRSNLLRLLLPVVILLAGITGTRFLLHARKPPTPAAVAHPGPLVEVVTVHAVDHRAVVHATGTIEPARAVAITPEVSGRVVEVAPNLVAGGIFDAGAPLFALEATDYLLAVEQAKATLAKAAVELTTTEGRAEVAAAEWRTLHPAGEPPPPLVVYAPQLAAAKATVVAAKAAVTEAELNLARTRITAPFACRVRSEEVEVGQVVRPGTPVAQVAGTDRAEVIVPLGDEQAAALAIPRADGGKEGHGSPATVRVRRGARTDRWPGQVVRALGEVDPTGRMVRVVAAVDDPYQLRHHESGRADLEVGRFVEVEIAGAHLANVVAIPRRALGTDGRVGVAGKDNRLVLRSVTVVWREGEVVFVDHGLADGERVVLTRLTGGADGMVLRPVEVEVAAEGEAEPAPPAAPTLQPPAVAGGAASKTAPAEDGR